jgi:hypothetical protein
MNDSLLHDETLPTADIAHSATSLPESATSTTDAGPLFPDEELNNFRARWTEVQTSFVDEPHYAVEQANSLVANVVKRIAEQFAAERATLEEQWGKGDNVSPPRIFANLSSATGHSSIGCSAPRSKHLFPLPIHRIVLHRDALALASPPETSAC